MTCRSLIKESRLPLVHKLYSQVSSGHLIAIAGFNTIATPSPFLPLQSVQSDVKTEIP